MRDNQPVTSQETAVREGHILVSGTDPDSRITFANTAFAETSGFSAAETASDGGVRVLFSEGTMSPSLSAAIDQLEGRGRAAA